ncbi:DNA helicase [Microbacterium sp.]|uniref:DNA helicase n=1 Tax=Microbacterium sp. TaxID=51671 RepID=UPI0039E4A984
MNLSRKRKKELRHLQKQANTLWESQQELIDHAGDIAREAGRQLGNYSREQVLPTVQDTYETYASPYVDKGVAASKKVYSERVVPAAGTIVGSALSVWDAANDTRRRIANSRALRAVDLDAIGKRVDAYTKRVDAYGKQVAHRFAAPAPVPEPKRGVGAGGVIALILGAAAALGVLYAAWQTLRADDELWVADDPLRAPEA